LLDVLKNIKLFIKILTVSLWTFSFIVYCFYGPCPHFIC